MKRLFVVALASALFALPQGVEAADLVLTGLQISFGLQAEAPHRHLPPQPVYIQRDDRGRHHDERWSPREHDRGWKGHRHARADWRQAPRAVVVDRSRHRCDEERVVIVRPGTTVVVADGRRW